MLLSVFLGPKITNSVKVEEKKICQAKKVEKAKWPYSVFIKFKLNKQGNWKVAAKQLIKWATDLDKARWGPIT